MGKSSAEKIGKNISYARGMLRWLKRQSSKLMRRLSKAYLDDAPRKLPIRGWTD